MAQVAATFTANISGYQAAMDKMTRSTQSMQQGVGSLASKVSSGLGTVSKVSGVAGAATVAMGVNALKSYGTFQQSLNKAAVVAGGTSKDIGKLSDMANRMGAELPLSAQDAADAMVSMAQDGASIKTITKEFPAIAQAATATGADLQTTAGTVQQAMNVWGDSLKSPQRAAAILTQTANLSNASIEDMSGAISNIGGTAKNAGFGLGDMSQSIGLLTNKGFTAQRASEDLNHAILQMMAPSDKARGAMDKLGLSFTDSSGKMKPFPQILREVAAATDGMTSSQKAAALKTMFNTAGMQAMLPLLDSVKDKSGNTATSWDAYAKALNSASKDTATSTKFLSEQATEMQQNVGSKIEQVGGNWEALSNKAMETKGGVNSSIIDMINKTLEFATKSDSSLAQAARSFIGLSPVIGAALVGVSGFTGQLNTMVIGVKNAGGMMKYLGGAINLPMIGIAALGAAFVLAYTKSETFRNAINGIGKAFAKVFNASWFQGVVSKLGSIFQDLAEITLSVFNGMAGTISGISWESIFGLIRSGIDIALNALKAVTSFVNNNKDWLIPMTAGIGAFVTAIKTISVITKVAGWISETITIVSTMARGVGVLKGAWTGLTAVLGLGPWGIVIAAIAAVVAALVTFFTKTETGKKMWSDFTTWLGTTWNNIVGTATDIWNGLTIFFVNLWAGISNGATSMWNGFTSTISGIWSSIVGVAAGIWTGLSTFFVTLWTGISTVATTIWNSIVAVVTTIWNTIVTVAMAVFTPISTFFTTLWTGIMTAFTTAWTGISTSAMTIWTGIVTLATGIWNLLKSVIMAPILILADFIDGQWNMISSDLNLIWTSIVTAGSTIWNGFVAILSGIWGVISGGAIGWWNAIGSALTTIWNALKSVASSVWNGIKSVVTSTVQGAVSIAKSLWSGAVSLISGIWNGLKSLAVSTWNGIKSVVSSAISGTVSIAQSLFSGLRSFMSGLWSSIRGAASSAWSGIRSTIQSIASGIVSGVRSAWSGFTSIASNVVSGIIGAFSALRSFDLGAAGRAVMNSFFSGLKDVWSSVKNFVSGIASWIRDHKGPVSYDAKLLIPAGNAIMTGLDDGLTARFRDVQKNVSSMAGKLATIINGVAGDIQSDTYAMQGAAYTGGDMNNSVDEDNWIKPTFYVHNELVGDKIQTIVNQGQAESSIHDRFFR